MEEKAFHIIEQAWKIVKEVNREKNRARKAELQKAVSAGKFLSDINDIWKAIISRYNILRVIISHKNVISFREIMVIRPDF